MKRLCLFLVVLACSSGVALEPPDGTPARLAKLLENKGDLFEREIKRLGNRTVELLSHMSAEGDLTTAKKVFGDVSRYSEWALHDINKKPNGGTYVVLFNQFFGTMTPEPSGRLYLRIDLPLIGKDLLAFLRFRLREENGGLLVQVATTNEENPNLVGTIDGYLFLMASPTEPGRLNAEIRGHVQLKSGFLYEALPERILRREAADRLERLVGNYQKEEARIREEGARSSASAVTSPSPKSKSP